MKQSILILRAAVATGSIGLASGAAVTALRNAPELAPFFYTHRIYQLVETTLFWDVAGLLLATGISLGVRVTVGLGWLPRAVLRPRSRAALSAVVVATAIPATVGILRIDIVGRLVGLIAGYFVIGPAMVGAFVVAALVIVTRRWMWREFVLLILGMPLASLWGSSRYMPAFGCLAACAGAWLYRAGLASEAAELAVAPEPARSMSSASSSDSAPAR